MPKGTYVFTGYNYPGANVPKIDFETPEEHPSDETGKTSWYITIHDAHGEAALFSAIDGKPEDVYGNINLYLYNLISSSMIDQQRSDIINKIAQLDAARPKPNTQ